MLLTSGQVSVAISSVIVSFFTLALFLSGYVLQQQTVNALRVAIQEPRPAAHKPDPQTYLPPQFALDPDVDVDADGETALVDGDPALIQVTVSADEEAEGLVTGSDESGDSGDSIVEQADQQGGHEPSQLPLQDSNRHAPSNPPSYPNIKTQDAVAPPTMGGESPTAEDVQPTPSEPDPDAEARGDEEVVGERKTRPISRAERRRKIREEVLLAGEGEGYKGYRRRMW